MGYSNEPWECVLILLLLDKTCDAGSLVYNLTCELTHAGHGFLPIKYDVATAYTQLL